MTTTGRQGQEDQELCGVSEQSVVNAQDGASGREAVMRLMHFVGEIGDGSDPMPPDDIAEIWDEITKGHAGEKGNTAERSAMTWLYERLGRIADVFVASGGLKVVTALMAARTGAAHDGGNEHPSIPANPSPLPPEGVLEQLCRAICDERGYDPDMEINDAGKRQWETFTELADLALDKARQIAALQAADPPEAVGDEVVKRLRAFLEETGPGLRPYVDHNGFKEPWRLRDDVRAALSALHQAGKPADGPSPEAFAEASRIAGPGDAGGAQGADTPSGQSPDVSAPTPSPEAEDAVERDKALRPFAAIADVYDDVEDDDFELWRDAHERDTRVTLGMCRAARAALAVSHPPEGA